MPVIARALFCYPPTGLYVRDDRCQVPVEGMSAQPNKPPLDLAYMAAVLESRGVTCRIRDFAAERASWEDFACELAAFEPDLLLCTVTTPTLGRDLEAFRIAKRANPAILTAAKGGHFAARDTQVMRGCPELDLALRGESERTVAEIAEGKPFAEILGLTWRRGAEILHTEDRPFLDDADLDALPFPARHLLRNDLYLAPDTGEPLTMIDTARGCPHQCIFCLVGKSSGRTINAREPKRVVDELEECIHEHGLRNFFFRADTFTFDEAWTVALCKEIVARKLRIRWGANSRVDTVSDQRLEWMKAAGCWILGFGIESGSQESLDRMKKRATLDDARNAIRLCEKWGIKTYGFFVIGLPWEDEESIAQTAAFMRELEPTFVDVNVAYPMPGTEYYDDARAADLFQPDDVFKGNYALPVVRTQTLSPAELEALRKSALSSFYLRPKYILRRAMDVRSLRELWNYARSAGRLLQQLR